MPLSQKFTEKIYYADGATPRYNGTPSARDLTAGGRYDYRYDSLDRLIAADYTAPADTSDADFSTEYAYDILSRPTSIKRRGVVDIDGRLKEDVGRTILSLSYNTLGLPLCYTMGNDNAAPHMERAYDATGSKLRQTVINYVRGGKTKLSDRRYLESFTFNADTLERIDFNGGYFDGQGEAHFLLPDWQGNVTITTDARGRVEQHIGYYPYGEPWREPSGQRATLYAAKERTDGIAAGEYDFGPRGYQAPLLLWGSPDRHAHKSPGTSPWGYCAGNPIRYTDFSGNDTISMICGENGIWSRPEVKVAKGDDIIYVTQGKSTSTYKYSEGEYGKRVIALNLEIEDDKAGYALGVYHVSGSGADGTGFYAAPGGAASNKYGSNARAEDGIYPIIAPHLSAKWRKPGLGGSVQARGVRFHYGREWSRYFSEGCFVLELV